MDIQLELQDELKTELDFDLQNDRLRSLGELSASILHEINQPLTGIRMSSELALRLLEKDSDENLQNLNRNLTEILSLTQKVEEIICRLQNFARNGNDGKFSHVNLNDAVNNALNILNHRFINDNIKITTSLDEIPPVKGHAIWLDQVFVNLLTNAGDALMNKGAHSDNSDPVPREIKIQSRFYQPQEQVMISVSDNAGSIMDEDRKKIFQPFFTTKKNEGSGLGLSITNMIIQSLNGAIDLELEEGSYSTFYVKLPAA
tara:strand:- start:5 stop:781 length:777 start_codon:yes stop_codon:yes gene_type:complete